MRSPLTKTVVIACPHCGTRYQVPPETVGRDGRRVSCAHCGEAWLALPESPPDDRLFAPGEEEALDREFTVVEQNGGLAGISDTLQKLLPKDGAPPPPEVVKSIEEIRAAIAPRKSDTPPAVPAAEALPPVDKAAKATKAAKGRLEKRQRAIARALPAARLLRLVRLAAVLLLIALVGGGYFFRNEIVRYLPDLAGSYAVLGLKVNVVGLEFDEVSTVLTQKGDASVLSVVARIRPVEARRVPVPPVLVRLLDDRGARVYEWSVAPPAADVAPGEALEFTAELASPPAAARRVTLAFADGRRAGSVAELPRNQSSAETDH